MKNSGGDNNTFEHQNLDSGDHKILENVAKWTRRIGSVVIAGGLLIIGGLLVNNHNDDSEEDEDDEDEEI